MGKRLKIIAFTGSIASGKTVFSKKLSKILGYPRWSADESVQTLLEKDKIILQKISQHFPKIKEEDSCKVRKEKLRKAVSQNVESLKKLEDILHPHVYEDLKIFLGRAKRHKIKGVILEIPLLFEVGLVSEVDTIVLVEASHCFQKRQALKRPGITVQHFEIFQKRFFSMVEKRKKSHIVLKNGLSFSSGLLTLLKLFRNHEDVRK